MIAHMAFMHLKTAFKPFVHHHHVHMPCGKCGPLSSAPAKYRDWRQNQVVTLSGTARDGVSFVSDFANGRPSDRY